MTDTLYDEDFVTWTQRQADALRAAARSGSDQPLDFENLAEEIESLGRSERREVQSLVDLIIIHILKLACSPADRPREKRMGEIDRFRRQLARVLDDNPSLKATVSDLEGRARDSAFRDAARSFRRRGETAALHTLGLWRDRGITAAEVLTEGLYPDRGAPRFVASAD